MKVDNQHRNKPGDASSRLFHFSENPDIAVFHPRPVLVPAKRPPGQEWLNGPLVWAIEERFEFMYLFPRDCPRILLWATDETSEEDSAQWLGDHRAVAIVERHRLVDINSTTVYRYEFPTESFENLDDAGMWISRTTVTPFSCQAISDLPETIISRGVDLRIVDNLVPFRSLWNSTLHVSGIRLRNAIGWKTV